MRYSAFVTVVLLLGLLSPWEGYAQDAIQEKLKTLAIERVQASCTDCEVSVQPKWMPSNVMKLDSSQIKMLEFASAKLPRGYQPATISFAFEGSLETQRVQLHVEIRRSLPVAAKRFSRNEIIDTDGVTMKRIDVTRMRKAPISTKKNIVGNVAARVITSGAPITKSDIKKRPLINAGETVKMVYKQSGIGVELDCTARQARGKGELIRLFSKETRKTHLGRVLTSQEVVWEKTL